MTDPTYRSKRYESAFRRKYGISYAERDALLAAQGSACGVCRRTDPGSRGWQLDHCHASRKVRGVLCQFCNTAIGLLRDDPSVARSLADYLELHR